jgi:hypothetical protein
MQEQQGRKCRGFGIDPGEAFLDPDWPLFTVNTPDITGIPEVRTRITYFPPQ